MDNYSLQFNDYLKLLAAKIRIHVWPEVNFENILA